MRKVHFKKTGAYVLMSDEEFEWAKKLAKSTSDPEHEKTFWETFLEKKKDPAYSLFTEFPKEMTEPQTLADKYVGAIREMILHGKKEA